VTRALEVLATGPFATVQDLGRPGLARLGVGRSGAADRSALRLANRLVGNAEGAAGIEVTYGGLVVRTVGTLVVALAGAPCVVNGAGGRGGMHVPLHLADGEELRLGPPSSGLRTYLAVRGGVAVEPVLGARASDTLAGLGPAVVAAGARLPVGTETAGDPGGEQAPCSDPASGRVRLRVVLGPRDDWFTKAALGVLLSSSYVVSGESDRVGMRLDGPALERSREGELPSEGMVAGALQVPPAGRPVLMLADHPVTGGYPVVAVVVDDDLDRAAQLRSGQEVVFVAVR
jgi:biotin-dependent carboxylase-like uncharacterized protein